MLVPYNDGSSSSKEDILETMTEAEYEKMTALHHVRTGLIGRLTRIEPGEGLSLVLDDFLFLGNMYSASDRKRLEKYQIKHIINVCDFGASDIIQENFNVIHISMADDENTNIKQHFDRTNELLHGFYEKKERCLVHCAAGISRSATIVLAYLMKYHHQTLKDAYEYLHAKRSQIYPNDGFMLQLIRYEDELVKNRELIPIAKKNQSESNDENPIETIDEFESKNVIEV